MVNCYDNCQNYEMCKANGTTKYYPDECLECKSFKKWTIRRRG